MCNTNQDFQVILVIILKSSHSYSFVLVSTECKLSLWNIVMGVLAMLATPVAIIVTINEGIIVCCFYLSNRNQKYITEDLKGELSVGMKLLQWSENSHK